MTQAIGDTGAEHEEDAALAEARRLIGEGEIEAAEIALRKHLRHHPRDAAALTVLGEIAGRFGYLPEAEDLLRKALAIAPAYADAQLHLANTLHGRKQSDDALAILDDLLGRDPDNLSALGFKASILIAIRRMDEGLAVHRQMLELVPDQAPQWITYAYLLKTIGRQQDSIEAYRQSLALNPAQGAAWWSLANLKTVKFDGEDVVAMEDGLAAARDDESRIQLHFALGKGLGDQGRFAESFDHYAVGNRLRRVQFAFDKTRLSQDVSKAETVFTPRYFAERAGAGAQARDPIFIISMHRAGSTLIEQILSSHPMVEGTEELFDIQNLAGRIAGSKGQGDSWLDDIDHLSLNELGALGENYLKSTRMRRSSDRPYFTDKMPGNWIFAGLIRSVLPNAKIIDVRRHPMGCCFANFTQYYAAGLHYSYDLEELGSYYRDYVRMMAHFDAVAAGTIYRVFHEMLVQDFEPEVRRLLDYLGLPFDRACLHFHETDRPIHTPSSEQVRQPIYRDGIEFWRNYEPWLQPLKTALGSVLESYPDVPKDLL